MEVKLCKGCNKMFQYISGPPLCPRCRQVEEELFQKVKEYLRENPGANMNIVSKETEVSVSLIEKFLRQGRLQVATDSPIRISCELCGKKITTGRYCPQCKAELANNLSEAKRAILREDTNKKEPAHGEKMRFLKSEDIRK